MSKTKFKIIISALLLIAIPVLTATNTYAASEDELYKKALFNSMYNCYNESEMYSSVTAGGSDGFSSFENDILKKGKKQSTIYIPTNIGAGNNLGSQKIGCYELFLGDKTGLGTYDGKMTGLLELSGKSVPSANSSNLPSFLSGMGYTEKTSDASSKKSCITAKYKNANISGDDYKTIGKVCWSDADLDGNTDGAVLASSYENTTSDNFIVMTPVYTEYGLGLYFNLPEAGQYCQTNAVYKLGYTPDDIKSLASSPCSIVWYDHYDRNTGEWSNDIYQISTTYSSENSGDTFSKYSIQSSDIHSGKYTHAYAAAREYLSGNGSRQQFSDNEKYELYSLYLNKVYQVQYSNSSDCQSSKPAQAIENSADGTKYYVHTSNGWCRIAIDEGKVSKSTTVTGFSKDQKYELDTTYDFEGLINAMFKLDINEETVIDGDETIDDASDGSNPGDPCYSGDIESMSWILCPALNNMAKATDGLIDSVIKDMLNVDSELYTNDSGAYEIWGYFRDIANIGFIIVLLVIIFSQLTGVGIDNYGIKKILPRLIAMAILINLSFIICQIAIDLSNILGESLNMMFQSIGKTIINNEKKFQGIVSMGVGNIITAVMASLSAAGAAAPLIVGIVSLQGASGATLAVLIIPLLIGVIIALVSVVMFFLMLGARTIIIVLFTALSPIAFLCYVLPNTQKLFKKWLDVMKAALVVFPICGGLYGLSFVIKAIVFGSSEVHIAMALVGVISPYLSFLVLPSLLKGALSGLGVVGNKLAGLGDSVKSSLRTGQNAVRDSEFYRSRQRSVAPIQEGLRARRTLGIDANGNPSVNRRGRARGLYGKLARANGVSGGSFDVNGLDRSKLTEAERRRLSDAEQAYNKYNASLGNAEATNPFIVSASEAKADAEARNYQAEVKRITDQFATRSNKELFDDAVASLGKSEAHRVAAISSMASRGMNKEMLQFLHKYGDRDEIKGSSNVLSAVMGSKEGVAFNWAKEQGKLEAASRVGFSSFTSDSAAANFDNAGKFVSYRNSLAGVAAKNGEAFVDSLTDDSMDYLGGRLSDPAATAENPRPPLSAARGIISANNWLKKLAATNKGKEQTAIIKNLTSGDYATISPTLSQLSRISGDAFGEGITGDAKFADFMSRIDSQTLTRLKQDYQTAKNKGAASNMDNRFRDWFEQNP